MGGKWGPCNGGVQPSAEVCDGKDNNCNGQVDENLTRPCSGQCGPGTQTCENGVWGPCSAREPSIEVCDGVDNDCDGVIDGPNALCDNGGVCINGRCTPPETRLDYGVMAGGGITCQIDGNGRPALPLSLLALLGLLLVRRRRPG